MTSTAGRPTTDLGVTEPATAGFHICHAQQWPDRLKVQVQSIAVRSMSGKCLFCSTNDNLTSDARLLNLPAGLQDYIHRSRAAPFPRPNHGKLLKSLIAYILGGI
jgi:hypothetical protein